MKKDITKLPKWVQKLIESKEHKIYVLEFDINDLTKKIDALQKVNEISQNHTWFTLGMHMSEQRELFILNKDNATKVCTIGEGDLLFIGRAKKYTIN